MIADDVAMAARIGGVSELTMAQMLIAYHRSRTPSPEEVEAVAQDIWRALRETRQGIGQTYVDLKPDLKDEFRRMARAALAASDAYRIAELERMK